MMVNDEMGNGGVEINACGAIVAVSHPFFTKYKIGDTLFIAKKAKKGLLRKVVIKEIRMQKIVKSNDAAFNKTLYVDTFNGLWYERELITRQDADMLIAEYQIYLENLLNSNKPCH